MSSDGALARHEAENLLSHYALCADECDDTGVANLFAEAEVEFAGTVLRGRSDVADHYRELFAAAPRSRHLLSNIVVDPVENGAHARCRYTRWLLDGDPTLGALGDYEARFVVTDGQWRFAAFRVSRAWQY